MVDLRPFDRLVAGARALYLTPQQAQALAERCRAELLLHRRATVHLPDGPQHLHSLDELAQLTAAISSAEVPCG